MIYINSYESLYKICRVSNLFSEGAGEHFGLALGYAVAAYYTEQVMKIRRIEIGCIIATLVIAIILMIVRKNNNGRIIAIAIFICIIIALIAQFAISQI